MAFMGAADKEMAARLRRARELAGFKTATEAARSLRIAQQTYLSHEAAQNGFTRSAAKYAGFYRVDLKWLLTGVGSPTTRHIEAEIAALPPDKQKQVFDFIDFLKKQ